jgi:hypothetical protein
MTNKKGGQKERDWTQPVGFGQNRRNPGESANTKPKGAKNALGKGPSRAPVIGPQTYRR